MLPLVLDQVVRDVAKNPLLTGKESSIAIHLIAHVCVDYALMAMC